MATFGQGTIGGLDNECFANFKQGGRYLLTDTGSAQFQITKITARLAGTGSGVGDQLLRAVVYADDGSGNPGTLLGSSDEVLIIDGAAAAWVDFNFSSPAIISGGTGVPYHLAIHAGTNGQTARLFYIFASGSGWHNADGYGDGPSNPAGSKTVDDADYSITATYSAYTPPTASIAISTPTVGQSISGVFLCSAAVTATPHHTQFEISADGITWVRLCAKNRLSPYEYNFNTWRFPNGTYQIRARYYTGSRPNTLLLTSASINFTINNPAGTTRDYDASLGHTISAALAASSDGDTIRLTGDFAQEGSSITTSKRVRIIKHPSAPSKPIIRTRLRISGNAYCEDVVFYQANLGNFLISVEQTGSFKRCEFSSLGTAANTGTTVGGLNAFDPDGAIDVVFEECIFHDIGDWLDPGFSTGGIHGVYNQHARRSYFVNCIAYSDTGFCWKLYPNAQETTVYKCLAYRSLASYYFGGDVGQATASTLGAQLLNTDTAATISGGVPSDWPSSGTVKIGGTTYLTYTGKSGTQITGLSLHSTISNGTSIDIYTNSNYNTIERCIGGWTGNDGAGHRYSEDGIVQSRWIGSGSPPKGVGNEVLETLLHDPATSGPGTEAVLGANAYIDNRTDSLRGNITDAGGNITGISPGYTDPTNANFRLPIGANAVGYGPDSIQPAAPSSAGPMLNVPLKAVLPFYAQAANHPLPADLTYADGSSLSTSVQQITPASTYILPNLLNVFMIGADRTGALLDGGQYLNFISSMTASGNSYNYQNIDFTQHDYVVQSGDVFQFDIYLPSASIPAADPQATMDLYASDGSVLRNTPPNDQNGISQYGDIRSLATDKWYRRRFILPGGWVGKTIQSFILAHEYDGTFSNLTTRYQNIYITDSTGDIIKYVAWQSGDGTPSYLTHAINSASFVSGNASTLVAPGPGGTSGSHSRRLRNYHIPSHTHTGSTSTDGAHAHSTGIDSHGVHNHNPGNGSNFAYASGTTWARAGATYFTISCQMASSGSAGAHNHNVTPPDDGSHAHTLTITTASSGGVNAVASAFDPRPRWKGMVFTLKSGHPAKRAISIPMGTVIMWYADTQNETLPNSYSYCDGSSLTSGNHSVPNQSGSMSYTLILPDLRNTYLIGADRTKAFGAAGTTANAPSGAPGPGTTGGTHTAAIAVANLPDHGHAGSTNAQWGAGHNHNWSIVTNAAHVHGPAASNMTSNNGSTEIQGTGGATVDEFKCTGATSTTSNDNHSHNFFIGSAGFHSHTITIDSNGSGSTWDNRSPFIGIIFLMKTTAGLASVPLKTIVGFRATTSSETLADGGWAPCDGATLTPGQFDMAANSGSNYVLPNFLKNFPIGADRTKTVANAGDQTNSAAGAPGPKGIAGTATTTMTTSTMPAHVHTATSDTQGGHAHGAVVGTSAGGSHAHPTGCHTNWVTTDGVNHSGGRSTFTSNPGLISTYSTVFAGAVQSDHGTSGDTQGAHSHTVSVSASGTGQAFHQRPRFHGLVFYMKVKR
jgi:hypothetical protein